jgi:tRNA G18 (ribose-2'-O)-methylase SpoU
MTDDDVQPLQPVRLVSRTDVAVEAEGVAALLPADCPDRERLIEVLDAFHLDSDRLLRGRDRLFLVESRRVVRRFLRSSFACTAILTTPEHWRELEPFAARRREPIDVVVADEAVLERLSGYRLHGGCLALGRRGWRPPSVDELIARLALGEQRERPLRLILLSGVVNVDNVGTIFRSAACFGIDGIVLDGACADPLLRKSIRIAMGRVFDVPWGCCEHLAPTCRRLADLGVRPIAVELADSARPIDEIAEIAALGSIAIVLGSEATGVPTDVLAVCDGVFEIRTTGRDEDGDARSLNVGVAASIAMQIATSPRIG